MINKNKFIDKLTVKNINTTFGLIVFVLVFLFTFFLTANEFANHKLIILAVFGSIILATIAVWVALALIIHKRIKSKDINKQKIDKALDKLQEDAIEEGKQQ